MMSQGLVCPPFVTRTHSEPSYPADVVFGKDRLGLRHAVLTQQHLDGGSESVSPFGGDSARGDTSVRCTECSSQGDPADLSGGLHSPLDQSSPQSSGRSMHDVFSDPAVPSGRHMVDPQQMFAVGGLPESAGLPTLEEIQRRLRAAMSSSAALMGGGPHPSAPPVMRHSSTDGSGFGAAARHRRSHSADSREVGKRLRVVSHDLDLSAGAPSIIRERDFTCNCLAAVVRVWQATHRIPALRRSLPAGARQGRELCITASCLRSQSRPRAELCMRRRQMRWTWWPLLAACR
jgi:hypothetical protein